MIPAKETWPSSPPTEVHVVPTARGNSTSVAAAAAPTSTETVARRALPAFLIQHPVRVSA
jgi:hypothetical protein